MCGAPLSVATASCQPAFDCNQGALCDTVCAQVLQVQPAGHAPHVTSQPCAPDGTAAAPTLHACPPTTTTACRRREPQHGCAGDWRRTGRPWPPRRCGGAAGAACCADLGSRQGLLGVCGSLNWVWPGACMMGHRRALCFSSCVCVLYGDPNRILPSKARKLCHEPPALRPRGTCLLAPAPRRATAAATARRASSGFHTTCPSRRRQVRACYARCMH